VYNWGEAELVQFTKHALASAHMTAQERAACLQLFSNKSGLAKDHVLVDEQLKTPAHQARIWQVRNFRTER
jgi:hypothetical protein